MALTGTLLLAGPTGEMADGWSWLAPAERLRAGRLRVPEDRAAFVAAHSAVRVVAGAWLGVRPEEVDLRQRCAACGGPHGRPYVEGRPEVAVTLSHARGYVAAAAGPAQVGVDVELVTSGATVPPLVLTPREQRAVGEAAAPELAALRLWVRKEAYVKAGLTTLDGLASFDVVDDVAGMRVYEWEDPRARALGCLVALGEVVRLPHDPDA